MYEKKGESSFTFSISKCLEINAIRQSFDSYFAQYQSENKIVIQREINLMTTGHVELFFSLREWLAGTRRFEHVWRPNGIKSISHVAMLSFRHDRSRSHMQQLMKWIKKNRVWINDRQQLASWVRICSYYIGHNFITGWLCARACRWNFKITIQSAMREKRKESWAGASFDFCAGCDLVSLYHTHFSRWLIFSWLLFSSFLNLIDLWTREWSTTEMVAWSVIIVAAGRRHGSFFCVILSENSLKLQIYCY